MESLTPIRVRGKRYRPGQKPSKAQRQRRASFVPSTEDAHFQISREPRTRLLSPLESLPPEILQHIFYLCPNINLPAATLPLAHKLSSPSLKKAFFTALFLANYNAVHNIKNLYSTFISSKVSADNGPLHKAHPTGDPTQLVSTLQTACLRLKWLTYPFIKEILQTLRANLDTPPGKKEPILYLDLEPNVHIPLKLLHGPWTYDKGDFLKLLFDSHASIEKVNSTDAEVYSASLMDAIRASDTKGVQMVSAFISFHSSFLWISTREEGGISAV